MAKKKATPKRKTTPAMPMHKMPGGMMMKDKDMQGMMDKGMPPKGMPPKKMPPKKKMPMKGKKPY